MATKKQSPLTRAALAKLSGVGPETLRFYEQKGLLEPPHRNAAGYRQYSDSDLGRLEFIGRAKGLGFSLQDIKHLLELTGDIHTPRKMVRDYAEARLTVIRRKIKDLKAMERILSGLVGRCDGRGELKGCPIADFVGGEIPTSKKGDCHE